MDANAAIKLSSTYPPPPMMYINNYTTENVKNGIAPPPPAIITENYTCFGKPNDPQDILIRSLESQNIERLYKNIKDYKKELKRLNHSLLVNYLDLLDILVKAPNSIGKSGRTLREEKLEDIELLFVNIHHLINELRPQQARDNLKCILEMQKEQRIDIATKFHKHLLKINDLLKLSIQTINKTNENNNNNNSNDINNLYAELDQIINKNKKLTNTTTNSQNETTSGGGGGVMSTSVGDSSNKDKLNTIKQESIEFSDDITDKCDDNNVTLNDQNKDINKNNDYYYHFDDDNDNNDNLNNNNNNNNNGNNNNNNNNNDIMSNNCQINNSNNNNNNINENTNDDYEYKDRYLCDLIDNYLNNI